MSSNVRTLFHHLRRRGGGALGEYGLLVALVAVAVIAALATTGERIRGLFDNGGTAAGPETPGGGGSGAPGGETGHQLAWSGAGADFDASAGAPATRIFVLTNVGTSPSPDLGGTLSVSGEGIFQIVSTTCDGPLAPGASCEAAVRAAPLEDGPYSGVLATSAAPTAVLLLSGVAAGFAPDLVWSGGGPLTAVAGTAMPATSAPQIFRLENRGTGRARDITVVASGARIVSTSCTSRLDPGEICLVEVVADFTANGPLVGAALSVSGGPSLPLTGGASGFAALLSWNGPATLTINGAEETPADATGTWTLRNDGTLAALLGMPTVSGAGWSVSSTTCASLLNPGQACTVTLRAEAADNGPLPGLLTMDGAPDLPLTGNGIRFAPRLAWTDGPQTITAAGAPGQGIYTLRNAGTLGTPVGAITAGNFPFSLVSTTCGPTLAPGATCTATVAFAPAMDGAYAGTLRVADGPERPISGQGTGVLGLASWSGAPVAVSAPATAGQTTMTLTNIGAEPLALGAPSATGAGFSVIGTDCGATLAPGASCAVLIGYAGATANGVAEGLLLHPGAGEAALAAVVSGYDPVLAWSGDATFTVADPAGNPATATRILTLSNTGLASSPIEIQVGGVGFARTGGTCAATLAAGTSCTVEITWSAATNGAATGTLRPRPQAEPLLLLDGTAAGFAPAYAWSGPEALAITSPTSNPASVEGIYTLTNIGTLAGRPAAPSIDAPGFAIVEDGCGRTLAIGASCEVRVSYTASGNASATATLVSGTATRAIAGSATGFFPALSWSGPAEILVVAPQTSATGVYTLSNGGLGEALLPSPPVSVSGTEFALISTDCAQALPPGASCAATVAFAPTQNGAQTGTLTAGTATIPLVGRADGLAPAYAVEGDTAFAVTAVPGGPTTAQRTLTVRNTGTAAGAPGAATISGPGFSISADLCAAATLAPGATCPIILDWTATANGTATGTLEIAGASVPLSGTGSGFAPAFAWDPAAEMEIASADSVPDSVVQAYALRNTGTAPGTPPIPTLTQTGGGAFSLDATTCGPVLAPGEACIASVRYTASANGTALGRLAAGTAEIDILGRATGFMPIFAWGAAPDLSVTAPTTNPAIVEADVTLTNVGTAPGVPSAPIVSGSGSTWEFTLASTTCGTATLQPGESCVARVRATYTGATADAVGSLTGPAILPLSGAASGFVPSLAWSGDATFAIDSPPAGSAFQQDRVLTLANGGAEASPLAIDLSGDDAFSLVGTTCGTTLAPGASCTATVRYQVSANGTHAAVLSSGGPVPAILPLAGSASGVGPVLSWSGDAVFDISSPAANPAVLERTLTLTNSGNLPATGLSPAVSGAGFSRFANACPGTLAPGLSCTVGVRLSATENGAYSGQIAAGGPNSVAQALSGTVSGLDPVLTFSGYAGHDVSAPTSDPASRTSDRTITITNTGLGRAEGILASVTGAGFSLIGVRDCPLQLAPGASCTEDVRFTATANGTFTGALNVALSNGSGASLPLVATASGFNAALAWSGGGTITHNLNTASAAVTYTLTNTGSFLSAPPDGALAISSTPAGAFEIAGGSCVGRTTGLEPGGSCTVDVRLPANGPTGSLSGTLTAGIDNAPSVALSGTRNAPFLQFQIVSGGALDASTSSGNPVPASAANGGQVDMLLRNTGTGGLSFTGGLSANATFTPSGPITNLSIVGTSAIAGASSGCNLSSTFTIAAGAACGLRITYGATDNGTAGVAVALTNANQPSIAVPITITGMGRRISIDGGTPTIAAPESVLTAGLSAWSAGPNSTTYTLRNSGNFPIGPITQSWIGDDPTDFAMGTTNSCSNATLAPGGSCTFTVRLAAVTTPALERIGAKSAILRMSAPDVDAPIDIPVSSTRRAPWFVVESASPTAMTYSETGSFDSLEALIVLRNVAPVASGAGGSASFSGSTWLNPNGHNNNGGFSVSGVRGHDGFTCATTIANIAPGHACALPVVHRPSNASASFLGPYGNTLRLPASASNGRTLTAAFTGESFRRLGLTSPAAEQTVAPGGSTTFEVTIRNTGNMSLLAAPTRTLVGASGGTFALGATTCSSGFSPGASCTQQVTLTAGAAGVAEATLRVGVSGAPDAEIVLRATISP